MNILIAPDKFKGTFSASEIISIVAQAIRKHTTACNISGIPLADGGEGSIDILTQNISKKTISLEAFNPVLKKIETFYYIDVENETAYIESASAIGLALLDETERNPMTTSSFGLGQLIVHALSQKVKKILVCLGGSAVNDAGAGMAVACGVRFFAKGEPLLFPKGKDLIHIDRIQCNQIPEAVKNTQIIALSDVENPLYGEKGAALVFSRQKGAQPDEAILLDKALRNFSSIVQKDLNIRLSQRKYLGAAGGTAASLFAFLDARIISGAKYISKYLKLEERIAAADLVITGEGRFDEQSLNGKAVSEVLKLCRKKEKHLLIIAGTADNETIKRIESERIHVISLFKTPFNKEQAIQETAQRIDAGLQFFFQR